MAFSSAVSRRRILFGLGTLPLLGARAGAADATLIRIGSSGNYPPFTFLNEQGGMTGILPDLLSLIGERTALRFTFSDLPWARAQKMVETGMIDGLCTVATAERRAYADFAPTPLYQEPNVFIYRAGNAKAEAVRSAADLAGLRIGAPLGSGMIKSAVPERDIVRAADTDNLLSMVAAGHIDGTVLGAWTTQAKLKTYGDQGLLRVTTLTLPLDVAIRFGLGKNFPDGAAILARVDAAIQAAKSSGAIQDIISRYVS